MKIFDNIYKRFKKIKESRMKKNDLDFNPDLIISYEYKDKIFEKCMWGDIELYNNIDKFLFDKVKDRTDSCYLAIEKGTLKYKVIELKDVT